MNRYIELYPRAWRARYGEELEGVLESERLGLRARWDLIRGALDAHLHPPVPSPLPVAAALTASALAVAHALAIAAQPVPTDWPGYLEDALPLIIGSVIALVPALIGLWLKLGDHDGALGRFGIVVAIVGHAAWLVALLAALSHVEYGPVTAAAATVAMVGTAALGVALVGHARLLLGVLVAGAALAGVAPPGFGWPAFAVAWTGVAIILLLEFGRRSEIQGGPRVA